MRAIALFLAFLASPAIAGTLPIAGSYGDTYGCKVSPSGNESAVPNWPPDWILVTPTGSVGHEWSCEFGTRSGTKVKASCGGEGFAPEPQTITVIENRAVDTLTYTDRAGTFILHRCR